MGAFEYTALDTAGKERKGVLEGGNARAVRQALRDRQLLPVTVLEVGAQEATRQKPFSFARSASPTDVALLTRQLATLARAGLPRPVLLKWFGGLWKLFWRVFAGLPMLDSPPWYGWSEWWYRTRAGWVFGVPLADVNSAFKLYRTAFLKRFPIQSDGDFVHVELVAKATFLTSIMDEIPLTPKAEPIPQIGSVAADRGKVFRAPEFALRAVAPEVKPPDAGTAPLPSSLVGEGQADVSKGLA